MLNFCFTLQQNHSDEFEWTEPESTMIEAFDMDMAVREFKEKYKYDLREITYYEGEDNGYVIYLNTVDGAEIIFDID